MSPNGSSGASQTFTFVFSDNQSASNLVGMGMLFNTTSGRKAIEDSYSIRRQTLMHGIPYFTALTSCRAAVAA